MISSMYKGFENRLSNFLDRFSIRQRILFIVLLPIFIMTVDAFVEFLDVAHEGEKGELKAVQAMADEVKALISVEYYERYRDMKSLGTNQGLLSSKQANVEKALNSFANLFKDYDVIVFTDLDGDPIGVNTLDSKGNETGAAKLYTKNFSNREWFKKVKAGKFTEDADKGLTGVYYKDAYIDHEINKILKKKPHLVTSFTTMVKDARGKPYGILHGKANFSWVEKEILHIYHNLKKQGYKTGHISLFNKKGLLLSDLDGHKAEHNFGSEDQLFVRDYEGQILKAKIDKFGAEFTKLFKKQEINTLFLDNTKKDLNQAVAYMPVKDEKFLDSIGWHVLVKLDSDELMHDLILAEKRFMIGLISVIIISILFALVVARIFSQRLSTTVDTLTSSSRILDNSVVDLKGQVQKLKANIDSQSSATEETSSAMTEINSMSQRNMELVDRANGLGKSTLDATNEADESNRDLQSGMTKMKHSFSSLEQSIESTLSEMEGLVKSVEEIAEKTNMINDIVFQTKLLSFNASVEAARAGEHGKGFAVVAEEVGSLAANSGRASSEISKIVEKSLSSVSTMVKKCRDSLKDNIQENESISEDNQRSAQQVSDRLKDISEKVKEVVNSISEVSNASEEQERGVAEVDKALQLISTGQTEISSGIDHNARLAEEFSELVSKLNGEASVMENLIQGSSNSNPSNQQEDFQEEEIDYEEQKRAA